ncbi:MBL fold metallo-hydrolase [Serratia ureilytica]
MSLQAGAAAPQAKTPTPGVYRIMLGSFEVTALSDGVIRLPADKLLLNTTPQQIAAGLAERHQSLPVVTSVNAYLINTGDKLVMIDSGAGQLLGDGLGKLVDNLRAAGYQPEQVDEIYLTHMHPDHLGGLTHDGKAVFPNAVVRAASQDADFWLSTDRLKQAKAQNKGNFEKAMATIKPYQAAGHFSRSTATASFRRASPPLPLTAIRQATVSIRSPARQKAAVAGGSDPRGGGADAASEGGYQL